MSIVTHNYEIIAYSANWIVKDFLPRQLLLLLRGAIDDTAQDLLPSLTHIGCSKLHSLVWSPGPQSVVGRPEYWYLLSGDAQHTLSWPCPGFSETRRETVLNLSWKPGCWWFVLALTWIYFPESSPFLHGLRLSSQKEFVWDLENEGETIATTLCMPAIRHRNGTAEMPHGPACPSFPLFQRSSSVHFFSLVTNSSPHPSPDS